MRHRKKKVTLDRKTGPRRALLKNAAAQFIIYEKMCTTEAKAKALRPFVERLITKGKNPTLSARRELLKVVPMESAVRKLLEQIGPRYKERPGGYTRIIKLGQRKGDGAPLARLELV